MKEKTPVPFLHVNKSSVFYFLIYFLINLKVQIKHVFPPFLCAFTKQPNQDVINYSTPIQKMLALCRLYDLCSMKATKTSQNNEKII
jgi:hypothetical protein